MTSRQPYFNNLRACRRRAAPEEYRAIELACRGRRVTAPELIRIAALKLAREL
jgi:hypothetical protein